jgi:hypothetical protein
MISKVKYWFATSPLAKTIMFFFSVIVSGVLSGTFVTEITKDGKIHWMLFRTSISFYLILIFLVLVFIYNRFLYEEDSKIEKFLDENYCKAYMRSRYLPELAKKHGQLIKEGKNSNELKDLETAIKDWLK